MGEAVFVAAEEFAEGGGGVIGGLGDEGEDGLLDGDKAAGDDAELGGWHGGCGEG